MADAEFHPDRNLPGCMMPDGGDCCVGYQALLADWRRLRAVAARAPKPDDDLAGLIAAKANEPAFREFKERLDANINWPRYLPILKVRPTGVTSWLVILPSGKEHIIGDEDWRAALTVDPAQPSWQPIETAPKKIGRHLRMFGSGSNIHECEFIGAWHDYNGLGGWVEAYSERRVEPTHWMELGPIPSISSTEGK